MAYRIFDQYGTEQDRAWLEAKYGNVAVIEADASDGKEALRVIRLQEREGAAALVAHVQYADGTPMRGVNVIRYAPPFDLLPNWESPPEKYGDLGVYGPTNDNGDIGFGMGTGDYYVPPGQQGASSISTGRVDTHSDCVSGLGMLPNTVHAHVDVVFQLAPGDEPEPTPSPSPSPEPPDNFEAAVLIELRKANYYLEKIATKLEQGWRTMPAYE